MERRISIKDYCEETGHSIRTVYGWIERGWTPKGAIRVVDERHPEASRPDYWIVMPAKDAPEAPEAPSTGAPDAA